MITIEYLLDNKEQIDETADRLTDADVGFLVSLLAEKDDELRYQAFQVLQKRSEQYDDVYPYWDIFAEKLDNRNSFQRNIGVVLLADNVKWDTEDRLAEIIGKYLSHCRDEKPITSRLTIQSIGKWIGCKPRYREAVKDALFKIDLGRQRDTMRKLILTDIIGVLIEMQKSEQNDDITAYFVSAITGGIMDKKSAKQLEQFI